MSDDLVGAVGGVSVWLMWEGGGELAPSLCLRSSTTADGRVLAREFYWAAAVVFFFHLPNSLWQADIASEMVKARQVCVPAFFELTDKS